jgi:hypothetical protein
VIGIYPQDMVRVREEVDDFERVCDDADGHELLAIGTAFHHHTVSPKPNHKKIRSRLAELEWKVMGYLSIMMRRSTIVIWAFLN